MSAPRAEKAYEKHAWVLFLALGVFGVIAALLAFAGAPVFGQEPVTALRTMGILLLGFSILTIATSFKSYRGGERWAWFTFWYWVVISLYFVSTGGPPELNIPLLIVALLGLLLPIRKFFPRS